MKFKWIIPVVLFGFLIACNLLSRAIGPGNTAQPVTFTPVASTLLPDLQSGIGAWASVPFDSGPVGGMIINVDPNNKVPETDKNNNQ